MKPPAEVPDLWGALWVNRREVVTSWDLRWSLALALITASFISDSALDHQLAVTLSAEIAVASALFGLVLAGLAIFVSFMSPEYSRLLDRAGGVEIDMFYFWWTAALAVAAIVVGLGSTLLADPSDPNLRRVLFGGSSWLSLWTLFSSLNLVALIGGHGSNRALQIRRGSPPTEGNRAPSSDEEPTG